jgi:hypothetical protein
MTRDVYAGDDGLKAGVADAPVNAVKVIRVRADADPDVLLRVASCLSALNRAPATFVLYCTPAAEANIEVTLEDCSEFACDMVCRKLAQLTCVIEVTRNGVDRDPKGHPERIDTSAEGPA